MWAAGLGKFGPPAQSWRWVLICAAAQVAGALGYYHESAYALWVVAEAFLEFRGSLEQNGIFRIVSSFAHVMGFIACVSLLVRGAVRSRKLLRLTEDGSLPSRRPDRRDKRLRIRGDRRPVPVRHRIFGDQRRSRADADRAGLDPVSGVFRVDAAGRRDLELRQRGEQGP